MSEDNLQKIIISTIKEEKHLGENLKQQCIEYIEDLQQRIDEAIWLLDLFISDTDLSRYDTLKILMYVKKKLKGKDVK